MWIELVKETLYHKCMAHKNMASVSANLYNVSSVFTSDLSGPLSVRFTDGSIGIYMPKKDFTGMDKMFEFDPPVKAVL